MNPRASLSVVICAYEASGHVGAALASIFAPASALPVEAVVVDDGSSDGEALARIVAAYPQARLVRHPGNRGMCAARNTGIGAASHDLVILLDADDVLVADWPAILVRILARWPAGHPLCFSACRTQDGAPTIADPAYQGFLTAEDMVLGNHAGEYLPMMERDWVAPRGYRDLGTGKSCGTLSYLAFARERPLWVSPEVLRIYTVGRSGSVTSDRSAARRRESALCAEAVLDEHGVFIQSVSPHHWHEQYLRLAYHRWRAGEAGVWAAWRQGLAQSTAIKSAVLALMFPAPLSVADGLVAVARRAGLLRRFG